MNKSSNTSELIKRIEVEKDKNLETIDKLIQIQDESKTSEPDESKLLEFINVERSHIISYDKLINYLKSTSIDEDYDLLYSFLLNATKAKVTLNYIKDLITI